jgi:L-Ala-D/L-Glu epimerase
VRSSTVWVPIWSTLPNMRIVHASAIPLLVPLREPFTIASARMETTRAALVRIDCDGGVGGLGEAACLYPVTKEDLPDVMLASQKLEALVGTTVDAPGDAYEVSQKWFEDTPVLAAAVESALVDALARSRALSVRALFGATGAASQLESDITIPIADASEMLRVGRYWHAQGFRHFKAKVGLDWNRESRALVMLHRSLADLTFRLDANAGFSAADALRMLAFLRNVGAQVACFEQPCARDDLDGMARVVRDGDVDVVADESLRDAADLDALVHNKAATSINLKLVKLGGFGPSLALGRAAQARGLGIMVGGMVETRLGMTCAAVLAATLAQTDGGVRYADLDTAWLLAEDPFVGGFTSKGPMIRLCEGPGFAVEQRTGTAQT